MLAALPWRLAQVWLVTGSLCIAGSIAGDGDRQTGPRDARHMPGSGSRWSKLPCRRLVLPSSPLAPALHSRLGKVKAAVSIPGTARQPPA